MPDDPTLTPAVETGLEPVVGGPKPDRAKPEAGIGLCLSGGGYRAMLFHAGSLIRLNELGCLSTIKRISSVSGGTITAAMLATHWDKLDFDDGVATNLTDVVIDPLRKFAGTTIDVRSITTGILTPFRTIGDQVARAYDKHLYDGRKLSQIPDRDAGPTFVFNATNVQTGKLFRFTQGYMADYTVGRWFKPDIKMCDVVAASSAFPPFLSPHTIKPKGKFEPAVDGPNTGDAYTTKVWLSDGGVYDNLGLETVWKRYQTVLVSDAGGHLGSIPKPDRDWARHGIRVANIADGQVRALRRQQAVASYIAGTRHGTYWGIQSDIDGYHLSDPIDMPADEIDHARHVPTRLAKLDEPTRDALINWGYVITNTAMRRWVMSDAARPEQLPARPRP